MENDIVNNTDDIMAIAREYYDYYYDIDMWRDLWIILFLIIQL